jgi:molybdopterin-dependent oxidoreductase alpha subunit
MRQPDDALRIHEPQRHAAGLAAVTSALEHAHHLGMRRSLTSLLRINQAEGFDCPGCAWPDPDDRSRFEFCENGAKAVAEEATRRRVGAEFFARHAVADLTDWSDFDLGQQGRLTEPVVLRPGGTHYEPISWVDAFTLIGGELRGLRSPDEAVFYTSGRTSNEAAFLYQLFVRWFGTNNLPDCSNMCHESSGVALSRTIGSGKGTVTLDDLHHTDLIFVVGQNPGTNHPRMLSALERAKEHGARIIAVNPLPEAGLIRFKNPQRPSGLLGRGIALADLYLQIRLNGDLALFQMLNRLLLEEEDRRPGEVLDHEFIGRHCHGYEEMASHARRLDPALVRAATGLDDELIAETLRLVLDSRRIVVCWAMGLTQHRNAVATISEVVNFLLLRGNIGRPGAGACPVRGHSNVQGDRTMGIHERPDPRFLNALADEFGFEPPRHHGYDTVGSIGAMRDGRVGVFVGLGGNFVAAAPDTEVTAAALRRCRLTVHVSTKLNRSHTVTGSTALILPCLGRTEIDRQAGGSQFVTVEDAMGVVHASRGHLPPASPELKSEVAIVCGMARATLPPTSGLDWVAFENDYGVVRDHISRVVPGFEDFEARVRAPGGFTLPHPARDERRFPTATGKACFTVNPVEVVELPPGRLLLQTLRSHDQYNTTIYGLDDRYRGIQGRRRVLFAHPDDLAALGLADGQVVDLESEADDGRHRRASRFRLVAYPVARSTCAAYFPEANALVPLDAIAEQSRTPISKSIVIRLMPPRL